MKLTVKIAGMALAAAALCGLGVATATAATPNTAATNVAAPASATAASHTQGQLRDDVPFYFMLINNCPQSLVIYTYQGGDWDYADGNPHVGTAEAVIPPGTAKFLYLNEHHSAVDAVGVRTEDNTGNLGLAFTQDQFKDHIYTYQINNGTNVWVGFHVAADGTHIGEFTISQSLADK